MTQSNAPKTAKPVQPDSEIAAMLARAEAMMEEMKKREAALIAKEKEIDSKMDKLEVKDAEVATIVREHHQSKAMKMKKLLDAQPKRTVLIPLEGAEKPGQTIPVTINGYRLNVPKGVYTELPEQVAKIIMDSQGQTDEAGREFRLDLTSEERSKKLAEAGLY